MKSFFSIIFFIGISLLMSASGVPDTTTNVHINISGIRSNKGMIRIGIFKNQTQFDEEVAFESYACSKSSQVNGVVQKRLYLPPGTYAISVLDDEIDNEKMDYNFFGIPKEGFGFSDYYHTGFSKPHFDQFKFTIEQDGVKQIVVRLRYIL